MVLCAEKRFVQTGNKLLPTIRAKVSLAWLWGGLDLGGKNAIVRELF